MGASRFDIENARNKRHKIYAMIAEAAAAGARCPTSAELAKAVGYSRDSIRGVLSALEDAGDIDRRIRGNWRIITITRTGEQTMDIPEPPRPRLKVPVRSIIIQAAEIWQIRTADIYGPSRRRIFCNARNAVYLVAYQHRWSAHAVGSILARDHTSVLSGKTTAMRRAASDALYRARLSALADWVEHNRPERQDIAA